MTKIETVTTTGVEIAMKMKITKKKKGEKMKVLESQYLEARDTYYGWCPNCGEFTRECTEPDAEGYDCPDCEQNDVVGADQAILLGWIYF